MINKNLGHATAYAYYKAGGGTMTEAEFTEFMADFGTASQTAVEAAQAALASKNAAQTAATTATNKASEATTAATTATTKAGEASTSASTATSAKDTAVSASQTATSKATEATTAAATATSAKTDAVAANTAAQSAKTAAQTAQAGAETAAASVQSSAAQIQTNADDISELKEDLSSISSETYHPIRFNWVHGGIDNATGQTNNDGSLTRSRDETYYKVSDLRSITNDSTSLLFIIFYTESNGAYTFASSTGVPANSTYFFDSGEYVRFDIRGSLSQANLVSGLSEIQIVSDVLLLKNDVTNMLVRSVNLADPSKFTRNAYMTEAGATASNTSYFYTGRIPVSEEDVLYFNSSDIRYVTAFNESVVVSLSSTNSPLTIPSGVTNVVFTGYMSRIDTFMVSKVRVAFIPYEKTIDNSYLKIENKNALNGNDGITVQADTLEADTTLELSDYPKILAQHDRISGYCEFSSFGEILFGYGYGSNKYIGVDDTNINIYIDGALSTSTPHGITISDYLVFSIIMDDDRIGQITINSTGGTANATFSLSYNKNGLPFIRSSTAITNVKLSAICKDIKNPIWWFGDSYSSLAPERIIGQLNSYGVLDRLLIDAVPGGRSYSNNDTGAYAEFIKLTKLAKPKYVIWALGMNDSEANYKLYLQLVKNYCDIYGITLYAVKIPSVPNIDNSGKNAYIDELGIKSIDWAKAVGATSTGVWRVGYLSSDNVHPTTLGAQAMALRTLVDCPAIMQF